MDYQRRVHEGYRKLVASDGLIELDARMPPDQLAEKVWELVEPRVR
jgi:thymidylate kinase